MLNNPFAVEDYTKIDAALEACGGNRAAAAAVLEVEASRITHAVNTHPALRTKWVTSNDVLDGIVEINESTTLSRQLPKEVALTKDEKNAVALAIQEKKFKKSLGKLGFKTNEIEAISAMESFAGQHFKQSLSLMHGGIIKSSTRLMLLAEHIQTTHLQNEALPEEDKKMYWDHYFRILDALRAFSDQANKAALTQSLINLKEKDGLGKPGLTQVNVNVAAASSGTTKVEEKRLPKGWTPPPAPEDTSTD